MRIQMIIFLLIIAFVVGCIFGILRFELIFELLNKMLWGENVKCLECGSKISSGVRCNICSKATLTKNPYEDAKNKKGKNYDKKAWLNNSNKNNILFWKEVVFCMGKLVLKNQTKKILNDV